MKTIFLDIDGVLSCYKYSTSINDRRMRQFDPDIVKAINKITHHSGATFVISSSWRTLPEFKNKEALQEYFKSQGLHGTIRDYTDYLPSPICSDWRYSTDKRYNEIMQYIYTHNITNYLVFEDDYTDKMEEVFGKRLIKCNFTLGFPLCKTDDAISILNEA